MSLLTKLPLFVSLLLLPFSSASTNKLTAYDVLLSYDFPVGLLPNGVTGYELNKETGEFKVFLSQTCKFHIESYELEYKPTIHGVITRDRITKLKGVSVKVLIIWLNIVEIVKDDDELQFSVGIASANFPLKGFEESPTCGCGFDCVAQIDKKRDEKKEMMMMVDKREKTRGVHGLFWFIDFVFG